MKSIGHPRRVSSLVRYWALIVVFSNSFAACGGCGDDSPAKPVEDAGKSPDASQDAAMPEERDSGVDAAANDSGKPFDPELCGNAQLDHAETCDDGNQSSGDGCSRLCQPEDGWTCGDAGAACDRCGDASRQASEGCDDGNDKSGDGCSSACKVEMGWSCPVAGQECQRCGDGVLQANERCDEGLEADAVGCTADCTLIEAHYSCDQPGERCVLCGDGEVQGKEVCDDGNTSSGDGCLFSCLAVEPGWVCDPAGGSCTVCGDGILSAGLEACDDGNFASGDGCSANCTKEPGAVCYAPGVLCSVCGNGYIEALTNDQTQLFEECDDGNLTDEDGCSSDCKHDTAYTCPLPGTACNLCGDGVVQGIERCDDHNTADDDGCSADCLTIAPFYTCTAGSSCVVCGNGKLETGEACDDGNRLGGDGCTRDCRSVESGYRCESESDGDFIDCAKCGDGVMELDEVCDDRNATAGDGCSADCKLVELGYSCTYPGYGCVLCGNAVVEPGQQCDEGGSLTAGCSASCQVVWPWVCPAAGQPCELCGDGQVGEIESCDDNNAVSGDGCSSICQLEPGYQCSTGSCLAAACGDGARAGNEQCDDANQLAGDGCSTVCTVEAGWACDVLGCHRTVCGDTVIETGEQCDDGNANALDGCSASCQLEANYSCPDPGEPCKNSVCGDGFVEGLEQCDDAGQVVGDGCDAQCRFETGYTCAATEKRCHGGLDDGELCTSELSCGDGDCSDTSVECRTVTCGDGVVEGNEACDDAHAQGECRGGSADGAQCTSSAMCAGGGTCLSGCTDLCTIPDFYECGGAPSKCETILNFVSVRRFKISYVSPDGLLYDPQRRSFAGHKKVSSQQDAIELCLDGSVIDANDKGPGFPYGTITRADGTKVAISSTYTAPSRPVGSGSILEAAYDPFTGRYLYLTDQGGIIYLADVPLCTVSNCPVGDYFQPGVSNIADYQVQLSGVAGAEGLTVGEDGDLYVTDNANDRVVVFKRRRDGSLDIISPKCWQTPDSNGNCTSFESSFTPARSFNAAASDVLDAIFTVPGERMLGVFNSYVGATSYTGRDLLASTFSTSEYFSFYQPSLGTNPPLYGRSALPGLLFDLGTTGTSYTKYAQSAETASDGGSFIVCPTGSSEDCQLFARICTSDAECEAELPGTTCNLTAAVPYCSARGRANDDYATVDRAETGHVIDVLANDTRSESSCINPIKKVISLGLKSAPVVTTITTAFGGTVTITNGGANVTYSAPASGCGFIDRFDYTADLGGGVLDDANVRVLVRCVCGDGVKDTNEQCDLGNLNGAAPARCSTQCTLNIVCGDGYVDPGEACDDGDTSSGDGCSALCTLETVCGDGVVEGAEECDDGNMLSGDVCNANCVLPTCGDGNVDVQAPYKEQCDLGLNNSNTSNSTCSTQCTVIPHCGNGMVELGEQCDDGDTSSGDGCSAICTVEGKCGNASWDSGEECDSAIQTTQCGGKSMCTMMCYCANYCGDGRIAGNEVCDDGNTSLGDGCRNDCSAEVCGDGVKDPSEQCDDGNNVAADKCTNNCQAVAVCGDDVLDVGEACDDGNQVSGDGCTSTCKLETGTCGNARLEFGEQCDDGNLNNGDECSSTCRLEASVCGDGSLGVGEQCDDGNALSGDGCDASCRFEGCGDGVRVSTEDCDDGNRRDADGCDSMCHIELL